MKKLFFLSILFSLFSFSAYSQDLVTVISIKANLRGTPDVKGAVVTTVNQGEVHELIKQKGAWFLIQTPKYVGWVQGNSLKLGTEENNSYTVERRPKPKTTRITETEGDSPFTSQYIGGDSSQVVVKNDSYKNMTLWFGGVRYLIPSKTSKTFVIDPGTYEYSATAPGVRSLSGSQGFERGHLYSWTFYIVTLPR